MITYTYERELSRYYLIIRSSAASHGSYREAMLEKNRIPGLLFCQIKYIDGQSCYYYDISSRQTFRHAFSVRKMKYQDLKQLFYQIQAVLQETEKYLLHSRGLLLGADTMYWDFQEERVFLVYCPVREEGEERADILRLGEDLLELLDYGDPQAVELGHRFYELTREENFVWAGVIAHLEKAHAEQPPLPEVQPATKQPQSGGLQTQQPQDGGLQRRAPQKMKAAGNTAADIPVFLRKAAAGIALLFGRKEWGKPEDIACGTPLEQEDVRSLPEEDCEPEYGETVCLFTETVREERRLSGFVRGKEITVSLDSMPFVVGKMKDRVSCVIQDLSVSRMHAKFEEKDGRLWLSDLNSKNGTYKNEVRLETGEKLEVRAGDEIRFGNMKFTYH